MDILKIHLRGEGAWLRPGSLIEGSVEWSLAEAPESIEVRLLWYTEGRGSRDVGVVDRVRFENESSMGMREFNFSAPESPYSFEGKLITLKWVVEAAVDPGDLLSQEPLLLSPRGEPVQLLRSGDGSI